MSTFLNRFKALRNPDRYHGWGKSKAYFEGWYYKMVNGDESFAFSLIPGISMDDQGKQHAFIQMIDGTGCTTYYEEFPVGAFEAGADEFYVKIGDNYFDAHKVKVNLPFIKADLEIHNTTPWPSSWGAPGVMGWYSFVPKMQCYHGVVSVHHIVSGSVNYKGNDYNWDDGIGYIEKDWGTSFPRCWIWLQSNHWDNLERKVSLMASVAHIPWMGRYFVGYLVAFYLDDHLLQFSTYNGAKLKSWIDDDKVYLTLKKRRERIEIIATKGQTGELISPISGEMRGKVNESLSATVELKYYKGEQLVYHGNGRNAGLEVAGDISILLTD